MRTLSLALPAAALGLVATPVIAGDLTVSIEIPTLPVAAYHRPYVAVWIEQPEQTAVRTLAVWYDVNKARGEGKDWLKDLRTWWRKGGRALTLPADGVSSATRAPGRQTLNVPAARLSRLPAGSYTLVVEAAREQGGRETVRVPFQWGTAGTTTDTGSNELGAVRVTVNR